MEHTVEAGHQEHHSGGRKEIYRITAYLTILTIVELALGFMMMHWDEESFKRHLVKGIIVILMMWKAFYIVGYFMHLKHEVKNLIMTIVIPLLLFVWFIIAFLYEGDSYKNLRNTYDAHKNEQRTIKVEKKEEGHELKKAVE
ncbi:cytochrome C oxidase subunit IV family protein [Chitinophagaceae bacterium LWZ2-11]